jgi:hypothetical protein
MKHLLSIVCLLVSVSACGHSDKALRKSFARAHNCRDVVVTREGQGYRVEGCGAVEICRSAKGPCESPTEELMLRARSAWATMRGCPETDIQVYPTDEGIAVNGCGGYGVCPGSAANCFAATPPSCADLARMHYQQCTGIARDVGVDGRRGRYYPGTDRAVVADVARNVTSTISENRQAAACQSTYQLELSRCPPG